VTLSDKLEALVAGDKLPGFEEKINLKSGGEDNM
jgi:hypothetical protein